MITEKELERELERAMRYLYYYVGLNNEAEISKEIKWFIKYNEKAVPVPVTVNN